MRKTENSGVESIYGIHAVTALLLNNYRTTYTLYVNEVRSDARLNRILQIAQEKQINIEKLTLKKMSGRFPGLTHQGVVATASNLPEFTESDLEHLLKLAKVPSLFLILDGITDVHNLGACLRSADAAGVDFVIIPKDNSASVTPVVSKISCGATESMPILRATNLVRSMETLKQAGVWIYGATTCASQTIYQIDCKTNLAIVLGAEDKGLRRLTREHCDGLFTLPMHGCVESLNVSVATGISLYEVLRQRTT